MEHGAGPGRGGRGERPGRVPTDGVPGGRRPPGALLAHRPGRRQRDAGGRRERDRHGRRRAPHPRRGRRLLDRLRPGKPDVHQPAPHRVVLADHRRLPVRGEPLPAQPGGRNRPVAGERLERVHHAAHRDGRPRAPGRERARCFGSPGARERRRFHAAGPGCGRDRRPRRLRPERFGVRVRGTRLGPLRGSVRPRRAGAGRLRGIGDGLGKGHLPLRRPRARRVRHRATVADARLPSVVERGRRSAARAIDADGGWSALAARPQHLLDRGRWRQPRPRGQRGAAAGRRGAILARPHRGPRGARQNRGTSLRAVHQTRTSVRGRGLGAARERRPRASDARRADGLPAPGTGRAEREPGAPFHSRRIPLRASRGRVARNRRGGDARSVGAGRRRAARDELPRRRTRADDRRAGRTLAMARAPPKGRMGRATHAERHRPRRRALARARRPAAQSAATGVAGPARLHRAPRGARGGRRLRRPERGPHRDRQPRNAGGRALRGIAQPAAPGARANRRGHDARGSGKRPAAGGRRAPRPGEHDSRRDHERGRERPHPNPHLRRSGERRVRQPRQFRRDRRSRSGDRDRRHLPSRGADGEQRAPGMAVRPIGRLAGLARELRLRGRGAAPR